MPEWTAYKGEEYLDYGALEARCRAAAEANPGWARLEAIGESLRGRPIWMLTLGDQRGALEDRPGFWLDGGTHAAEWTGVMAALYTAGRWLAALAAGDERAVAWFSEHTAYVVPCVSPDGFQAMIEGAPYLRSTLRPHPPGTTRAGWEARDIDGDGRVRQLRWRHPAGPWVPEEDNPQLMRQRRLEDDPERAYFVTGEGEFLNWDGVRWTGAPREFGLDLNRNFPGSWAPFSMFGMDGGDYPLSAPESRALVEAFRARRRVAAALTNHTYTGCILTQPYRKDSPIPDGDVRLMERLAKASIEGTGYACYRVCPDFMYDPARPIPGVWADTLSTVFGLPGYTLELWNPLRYAGVEVDKPIDFFMRPEPAKVKALMAHFYAQPGAWEPWRPFEHPQLGAVEIGGLEYMRTVRNPPEAELPAECERAYTVADRLRLALPQVTASLVVTALAPGLREVALLLENRGYLGTGGLEIARSNGAAPPASARLVAGGGARVEGGPAEVALEHMEGWGELQIGSASHPVYAGLSPRGHRAVARWRVRGEGPVSVEWDAGRGGRGVAST